MAVEMTPRQDLTALLEMTRLRRCAGGALLASHQ